MTCDMCGKKPDPVGAVVGCWLERLPSREVKCSCGRPLYRNRPYAGVDVWIEAHEEAAKIFDRVVS
jgi:hypothetical protein